MALDARTRSSLYGKLARLLGDHDANALMSEFPSVEAEELVTREHLRAELALTRGELRAEIADLGTELRAEIADLGTELRAEIADLGTELRSEIADLGTELRAEIGSLRLEVADRFQRQTTWLAGTVVASAAVVVAAIPLLS